MYLRLIKNPYNKILKCLFNERTQMYFFNENEVGWLTLDEIAERCNISKKTIYGYIVGLHMHKYLQRSFWSKTGEYKYRLTEEYFNYLVNNSLK